MKIAIQKQTTLDELNAYLTEEFPEYEVKIRRGVRKFVQVKKSAFVGAWVFIDKKNKIVVNGGIPSNAARAFLGGLIFYLFIMRSLKAIQDEVGMILEDEYGDPQLATKTK